MSDSYTLREEEGCVVVVMAEHVPFPPGPEERAQLENIIQANDITVVDLAKTAMLGTLWLRLFAELTERAEAATRDFRIAAANDALLSTRDYIGLEPHLRTFETVEAAKQA